jgi:hypothetical protein
MLTHARISLIFNQVMSCNPIVADISWLQPHLQQQKSQLQLTECTNRDTNPMD